MIDAEEAKTIEYIVHSISMGDSEDPDLYVAAPIWEWQQTEAGKYVMANSVPTPMWVRDIDSYTFGHRYSIKAYFTPKKLTYYRLKFE